MPTLKRPPIFGFRKRFTSMSVTAQLSGYS
jgi:hypothetical protein